MYNRLSRAPTESRKRGTAYRPFFLSFPLPLTSINIVTGCQLPILSLSSTWILSRKLENCLRASCLRRWQRRGWIKFNFFMLRRSLSYPRFLLYFLRLYTIVVHLYNYVYFLESDWYNFIDGSRIHLTVEWTEGVVVHSGMIMVSLGGRKRGWRREGTLGLCWHANICRGIHRAHQRRKPRERGSQPRSLLYF